MQVIACMSIGNLLIASFNFVWKSKYGMLLHSIAKTSHSTIEKIWEIAYTSVELEGVGWQE
jgi:hypothetical protein